MKRTGQTTRWAAGTWATWTGQAHRNRARFYAGKHGLRMLMLHHTYPAHVERFQRMIQWCGEHLDIVGPEAADDLAAGTLSCANRDKLLVTFDDGHADTFAAAEHLAAAGVRAIFFVVPSFLGRTTEEFVAYHGKNAIHAYPVGRSALVQPARGMAARQVREIDAMGHRVAAHNYAHRDLGTLHGSADLEYEIQRSVDELEQLLGKPCDDFAIAYGHPQNASPEATRFLQRSCKRVYACVRGLNVPGISPAFMTRDSINCGWPTIFSRACVLGAIDDRFKRERDELIERVGCIGSG